MIDAYDARNWGPILRNIEPQICQLAIDPLVVAFAVSELANNLERVEGLRAAQEAQHRI